MIFRAVGDERPRPEHDLSRTRARSDVTTRQRSSPHARVLVLEG